MMNSSLQNKLVTEKLVLKRAGGIFPAAIAAAGHSLADLKEMRHSFLHEKELLFFDGLKLPKTQHSYLLGRYAAKMALKSFMEDVVVTDAWIAPGIFQQPVLYVPQGGNIQLSISHTTEVGIAVVFSEEHPMGVDVEAISMDQIEAIKEIVTPGEQHQLSLIDADINKSLTVLWTVKEALSKILKTGLMTPFSLYEIENVEYSDGIITCSFINFPQYKSISWLSEGHAWSVVLPKKTDLDREVIKRLHF
ncbi:4'-phosphopantetheinyl transferase family protein [Chryseobacterium angstadtii]|uniref:4'-phosphopantetheinyl transferase family protein n=1 Tax=Chryseobacterium angstadtii TaxID=558151 RepID=UPI00065AD10B|nr:4'-phosphopantetheinyl transferase superfamily protein [Chryseobacterium angstadtii]